MHTFDHIGILGTGFLTAVGAAFVAVVVSVLVLGRRHRWWRWSGGLVSLLVALVFVAASINNHYAYLPNLGSLWGWRAADQANWSAVRSMVRRLDDTSRPPGHGMVVEVPIPGEVSHFQGRPAAVYLPPAWFRRPHPALPVVELLHGTPGSPRDWTRSAGADLISDRYASTHHGEAPILVSPDINGSFSADSECTNGRLGNVETYLTVDVPRWVDTYLHPARPAREWAVGGLSEGGTCAMDISLRHPTEFPTFLDFGGEERITHHGGAITLFSGSARRRAEAARAYDPVELLQHVRRPGRLSAWFEVGSSDRGISTDVERLYGRARALGLHARLRIRVDGHHSFRVWRDSFADSLPWLGRRMMLDRHVHRPTRLVVTGPLLASGEGVGPQARRVARLP